MWSNGPVRSEIRTMPDWRECHGEQHCACRGRTICRVARADGTACSAGNNNRGRRAPMAPLHPCVEGEHRVGYQVLHGRGPAASPGADIKRHAHGDARQSGYCLRSLSRRCSTGSKSRPRPVRSGQHRAPPPLRPPASLAVRHFKRGRSCVARMIRAGAQGGFCSPRRTGEMTVHASVDPHAKRTRRTR